MKAAVRSTYGSPAVLHIQEVAMPAPRSHEVLVKVYATTVNRTDCGILWGHPYLVRLFTGLRKPRASVTGSDFAGMIEAVGAGVTAFKVGDKVMGFEGMRGCGSHAHYLTIPETRAIMTIPEGLTYEEAAACLEGAFYAASGIRYLKPKEGQKALVNGATGAIGSATVQILKTYGVQVTAVCRGEHAELVRSLGADRIIDYTREDFTKDNEQYDYVFDSVGKSTFKRCKHLLKRRGIYTSTDGFENLYLQLFNFLRGGKRVVFLPPNDTLGGLHFIKTLIERGSFRPVIDRQYPLERIADAYTYVAEGKKIGNVIIAMN